MLSFNCISVIAFYYKSLVIQSFKVSRCLYFLIISILFEILPVPPPNGSVIACSHQNASVSGEARLSYRRIAFWVDEG